MAEQTEGLSISIEYINNNKKLKEAQKEVAAFSNTAETKFEQAAQGLSKLQSTFKSISSVIKSENASVGTSFRSYNNALSEATKAQNKYNASLRSYQDIQSRIDTIKQSLPNDISSRIYNADSAKSILATYNQSLSDIGIVNVSGGIENARLAIQELIQEYEHLKTAELEVSSAEQEHNKSVNDVAISLNTLIDAQMSATQSTQEFKNSQNEAADTSSNLSNQLDKVQRTLKRFRFNQIIAMISTFKRLAKAMFSIVEASSSWIENLNLLESVFKGTNEEAKKFIAMAADDFGLDQNALAQYVSTFKQMANAMGQVSEVGTKMSEVLTLVALDVASLRNVDISTAVSDFTSALAGQVKPVRKYGFDITASSIDELLKTSGIGGSSSTLSQAEKQLARAILLIRQSQDAWGDLGKTINTFANQQRVLNDQWKTTLRLFGNLLIGNFKFGDSFEEASKTAGIATKMLWYLNGALIAVNQVLQAIVPSQEEVNTGAIAAGADEAAEAFGELDEAMQGNLADFDKFNVLNRGNGASNGINELLNQLLQSEADKYLGQYSKRLEDINMYAKQIANTILGFVFPAFKEWLSLDENKGKSFSDWVETTDGGVDKVKDTILSLGSSLRGIISLLGLFTHPLLTIIANMAIMSLDNEELLKSLVSIGTSISSIMSSAGKAVANLIITSAPLIEFLAKILAFLIKMLDEMDLVAPVLFGVIGAIAIIKNYKLIENVGKLITSVKNFGQTITVVAKNAQGQMMLVEKSITGAQLASAALVAVFAYSGLINILDELERKFGTSAKGIASALLIVAGAVGVAATAWAVYHTTMTMGTAAAIIAISAAAVAAGVIGSIESAKNIKLHANGGYQTGGLFYAGENGAEWVGRQGSTSTILNDKQMSDIMKEAVAEGTAIGNQFGGRGTSGSSSRPINIYLDGKKLFEVVEDNGRRQGKVFAKA